MVFVWLFLALLAGVVLGVVFNPKIAARLASAEVAFKALESRLTSIEAATKLRLENIETALRRKTNQ